MDSKNKKILKILIILILICVLAWEISVFLNFKNKTVQNINIEKSTENIEIFESIQDLEFFKDVNSFSEKNEQCLNSYSNSVNILTLKTFFQLKGIKFFVSEYAKCLAVENNQSDFCEFLKDRSDIVEENTMYDECQNTFDIWNSFFSFLKEEKNFEIEEICSEIVLGETSSLVKDFTLERCQLFIEAIQNKSKEKCQIIDIDNFKNSCFAFVDNDINLGMEFLSEQEENESEKDIIKLLFPKIFQTENNICYNYFHKGLVNVYCGYLFVPSL